MKIKSDRYQTNLKKYFNLRYKNGNRNILEDTEEYCKFIDNVLNRNKIFNTIIIVKNRKEILDHKFELLDKNQVAKEEICKLEYSICSNVLHDLKQRCEVGNTIYFFKFNSLGEISSFLKKIKEEKIQIEYYTTLFQNKKIIMNKTMNIINDKSTNNGLQIGNKTINDSSNKKSFIDKIFSFFKFLFK